MAVGADGDSSASTEKIVQWKQAIAQVRLCARAEAYDCRRLCQGLRFIRVHMRRMHQAPLISDIEIFKQPTNRTPAIEGHRLVDLTLLLSDMQMHRQILRISNTDEFD